ncbi:hypothetical protein H4Q26_007701 [Puccinia striiformis f. sp. tritici PST-130]|nr:hypothetical protein H4Q26_007701 [Puccinia striiformis f. sp. tritici PST-130]
MAESIQNWACNHGFAIVVGNSDFTRDPKIRKADQISQDQLPISMNAVLNADNMWVLTIKNGTHNHGPSDDPSAHHMHRRMTEEVSQEISKLANAEQQYKHNLANLANHSPPEVMEYLTANWIPIKNHMHAALKRFLKGATSSLRTTISDMYDAVRHQLHEVLVSTATQKMVHINNLPEILSQLGGKISHAALKMARRHSPIR